MQRSPAVDASRRFRPRPITLSRPLHWLARGWRRPAPQPAARACCTVWRRRSSACTAVGSQAQRFWLLAGAFSGFLMRGAAGGHRAVRRQPRAGARRAGRAGHGTGRLAPAPRAAGGLRPAAGAGRHRLGADLGGADHRLRAGPVRNPMDFLRVVVLRRRPGCSRPGCCSAACSRRRCSQPAWWRSRCCWTGESACPRRCSPAGAWCWPTRRRWRCGRAHHPGAQRWSAWPPALIGLVVVVPWLAHASWHAYRDLVEPPADDARG